MILIKYQLAFRDNNHSINKDRTITGRASSASSMLTKSNPPKSMWLKKLFTIFAPRVTHAHASDMPWLFTLVQPHTGHSRFVSPFNSSVSVLLIDCSDGSCVT